MCLHVFSLWEEEEKEAEMRKTGGPEFSSMFDDVSRAKTALG